MAKKVEQGTRRGRPNAVASAKRSGPGKGFWLAIGLVAVIGIGALAYVTTRPKAAIATVDPSLPPMKAQGYVIGSPTAPIEILEFADFECPGCGQFATLTEPDIRTRLINTGQIRMRYLDYPLPMHKNTWDASLAAACANDQGKFWEMHDAIFQNQDKWNGEATSRPRGPLGELAKGLGLDMAKYGSCMEAETHRAQIAGNLAEAERRQIGQTPTFVIGGKVIPGALPFDQFKKLVDDEIAKLPKGTPAAVTDTGAKKGT
ncbi:MAG: DsbA family protein [Gemmatimonadaceae bacterium]